MGRSACLLAHGAVCGGTSDALTWEVSSITYSPNTVTNKKPALGGLEKAQALRSFLIPTRDDSPAMMPSSHSGLVGTGVAADEAAASAVTLPVGPVSAVKTRSGASHPEAPCA